MLIIASLSIIVALIIIIQPRLPYRKVWQSERLVRQVLSRLPSEYVVFNDLLFESNGRSTQIDHLVISPYGVFVIETKGLRGWICGGENSEYWTQTIFNCKHRFYNPIRQNEGHMRFLRHLLKCPIDIPYIPIVVFGNNAELKINVQNYIVVNRIYLQSAITQYKHHSLDNQTVNWIVETIKRNRTKASKESVTAHVHNATNMRNLAENSIKQKICPHCGGQLVLRHGMYGYFYGCSNYPQCKISLKC